MADLEDIDTGPLSPENKAAILAEIGAISTEHDTPSDADDDPASQMREDGADVTSAKPKVKAKVPAIEEKEKPKAASLTENQQLKLRVKQEAQRYREAAQKKDQEAEKRLQAAMQKEAALATQQAEYDRKMQEIEALKKKAREAPKDFLTDVGTSLDRVVQDELEYGKPDARATAAEREIQRIRAEFAEFQKSLADEKAAQLAEAEKAQAAAAHQKLLDDQKKAEETLLNTIKEGDYPELEGLLDEPGYVLSMGYAAHSKFKVEHGRDPSFEELAATLNKALAKRREKREDEEDAKPKAKRKGAVSAGGNAPTTPPDIEEMSEEDRVKYATKHLKQMRREQAKKEEV